MDFLSSADLSQRRHCYTHTPHSHPPAMGFNRCENCGIIYLKDRDASFITGLSYISLAHLPFWGTGALSLRFIFPSFLPCSFSPPSFLPSLPLSYFLSLSSATQVGLELVPTFLPQPLECWGYRRDPPHTQACVVFLFILTHCSITSLVICGSLSRE